MPLAFEAVPSLCRTPGDRLAGRSFALLISSSTACFRCLIAAMSAVSKHVLQPSHFQSSQHSVVLNSNATKAHADWILHYQLKVRLEVPSS